MGASADIEFAMHDLPYNNFSGVHTPSSIQERPGDETKYGG